MPVKAERRAPGRENERLRARLEELEETLRAIRSGEVDALVVETAGEDQVFTLKSADQTYRLMVEEMQTGAATLRAPSCGRSHPSAAARHRPSRSRHTPVSRIGWARFGPASRGTSPSP
jgi:hypothetical protein